MTIKYAIYPGDNSNPVPQDTRTTKVESGITWNRHPNGGGWVAETAKVDSTCFIGINARIYGNSEICHYTQVYDNAQVYGSAKIDGDARICGYAQVFGFAKIGRNARIYGHAVVYGNVTINPNNFLYINTYLRINGIANKWMDIPNLDHAFKI